jgi:hypothetical protein
MLRRKEVDALLADLCVRLGFCLAFDETERLRNHPPTSADAFTNAVYVAAGLSPVTADRGVYKQVLSAVTAVFQASESARPNKPLKQRRAQRSARAS